MNKAGCPTGQIYDPHKKTCALPKNNLRPMTCWPGGKSRVSKTIVSKIPDHTIYVEPFVGGGSIYFQKDIVKTNIINDKNQYLINYYKKMARLSPHELRGCKRPNHKQWERIKKKFDHDKPLNTCEFWQVLSGSYACKIETWGAWKQKNKRAGKPISINVIKNLAHYQNKLNKTKILNQDYKIIIQRYDGKNVFFYVDPPYPDAVRYHQPIVDPKDVAHSLKNVKGKVMISYNNHPSVRAAFPKSDGWKIQYLPVPYTMQDNYKKTYNKLHKELLITNF